ncbi:MAG: hypothetical protein HOP12_10875 [Candidatus Eisenbacteria bacterium]|uniref:PorT family protein n=1 Tax=Eiseniibacteriota bacterium TaxID=2212470 RepID=A0A849SJ75_UNCEI|nr:hypothetical protein [Candidatus Eisenbacteria bacterium]
MRKPRCQVSSRHAAFAPRTSFAFALALACSLASWCIGASAAHAEADRFRVDLLFGRQFERFQSRQADSLGLSVSDGLHAGMEFDFDVMRMPMKGKPGPGLRVSGRTTVAERVFAIDPDAVPVGVIAAPIEEAPTLEVFGGIGLQVPLGIVDGDAGTSLFVRYEGGIILARGTEYDFIDVNTIGFGFERDIGIFEGSLVEVKNGRNELFGPADSKGRWNLRFRIVSRLGGFSRLGEAPAAPAAGRATATPAGVVETGRPLRAFFDLCVDSDGGSGADGLGMTAGVAADAGMLARRLGGLFGL